MPKKTRREKIIAELRRKLAVTKGLKLEVRGEKLETEVKNGKAETKTSYFPPRAAGIASGDARQNLASNILLPTSYLKKDLTKTFTLAILAISLELVLYFWLR